MLLLLVVRLFYVSVLEHGKYTAMVEAQRNPELAVQASRGIIYDRNMIKVKENQNGVLSHLIGYVSEGGNFGLEKAFNDVLAVDPENKTYSGIKLSVDYHIQKITEEALDNNEITGAAVVVDVESGDILAMASRPNFQMENMAEYMNSQNGELLNRALSPYDAGSVFKVVVASAALENGYSEDLRFQCDGEMDIDGLEFVCSKKEGHGNISFPEALALSCNCAFYEMGETIGESAISACARNFGFGQSVLNIPGLDEAIGFIPDNRHATPREIANLSIGQGQVMVTPLQVADMLCTIANGGMRKQLTLIKGFVDDDGSCQDVKPVTLGRVVNPETARMVKSMLICGVQYGTGAGAYIDGWGAGGKTGTAQTGWLKDGEPMTHGWFAGFFPEENPKYVCAVLAENGQAGSVSAVPVFKEIGENIKYR